jgi:hypothetical protein
LLRPRATLISFALEARAAPDEALELLTIDEKHRIENSCAPDHWKE